MQLEIYTFVNSVGIIKFHSLYMKYTIYPTFLNGGYKIIFSENAFLQLE